MRRQGLDIFVNRIASHHELQQSEDLRTFLQADEEVMFLCLMLLSFTVLSFAIPSLVKDGLIFLSISQRVALIVPALLTETYTLCIDILFCVPFYDLHDRF